MLQMDNSQICNTSNAHKKDQHSKDPSGLCISKILNSYKVLWTNDRHLSAICIIIEYW